MESIAPSHLLCVYAEPLAKGRRVLVVGDSTDDIGTRLMDLGARLVHIYDPVVERTNDAEPARGVLVRPLYPLHMRDFDVRDGAFDLVLVPELVGIKDPVALLARLRRVVGADGAVIVATKNVEAFDLGEHPADLPTVTDGSERLGIDYYDLYEMMSLQFSNVRMIGQVPFYGAAIAELGDEGESPDVSVHTDLMAEADAPTAFIALGSHSDEVRLDPYAIVQLPRDPAWSAMKTQELPSFADNKLLTETLRRTAALEAQIDEQRHLVPKLEDSLEAANERVRLLEADLDRRRQRIIELEEALQVAQDDAIAMGNRTNDAEKIAVERGERCVALASQVEELGHRVTELVQRADDYARKADELSRQADDRSQRAEELGGLLRLEHERAVAAEAQKADPAQIDRLHLRIAELEAAEKSAAKELARAAEAPAAELAELEAQLRERGRRVAELEREVRQKEKVGLDLVAELEEARSLGPAEREPEEPSTSISEQEQWGARFQEMREKLDAMALDAARREGELHARAWQVAELEHELVRRQSAVGPERLSRAEAELDILRRALAQEHEARSRVESGEELAKARAELQRQAVLLEQLSRELDASERTRDVREPRDTHGAPEA
jgi:hypothetical protein